eukprot:15323234-Heterocapsa_arctica.AAC.1
MERCAAGSETREENALAGVIGEGRPWQRPTASLWEDACASPPSGPPRRGAAPEAPGQDRRRASGCPGQ